MPPSTNGPRHARPPLRALPQRGWPLDAPTPPHGVPAPSPQPGLVTALNPRPRHTSRLLAAAGLVLTSSLVVVGVLATPAPPVSAPGLSVVAPPASAVEFGDGTHRVGAGPDDVTPGRYVSEGGRLCNWSVISAGGSHSGQGKGAGQHEVTLRSAQKITSGGCGQWTRPA